MPTAHSTATNATIWDLNLHKASSVLHLNQSSPIFSKHTIHDDLIIETKMHKKHKEVVLLVMQEISNSGLTLNPEKCSFGEKQIKFWGMLIDKDSIRSDPPKVEALDHISFPTNKEDLISFL